MPSGFAALFMLNVPAMRAAAVQGYCISKGSIAVVEFTAFVGNIRHFRVGKRNIPPHPWKILFGHRQRPHIGCMCGLQSAETGGFILFGGSRQAAHGSCASHDEALRHIRFDIMALSHISCVNIKHFGFYTGFRVYTKSGIDP